MSTVYSDLGHKPQHRFTMRCSYFLYSEVNPGFRCLGYFFSMLSVSSLSTNLVLCVDDYFVGLIL
jgi:hypothetical protein